MDAVMEKAERRKYRDCYGNTAEIVSSRDGVVLTAHLGDRVAVHHLTTVWGAFNALRQISGGGYWTEV